MPNVIKKINIFNSGRLNLGVWGVDGLTCSLHSIFNNKCSARSPYLNILGYNKTPTVKLVYIPEPPACVLTDLSLRTLVAIKSEGT